MESNNLSENFQSVYESLVLQELEALRNKASTPSSKAQIQRKLLAQLYFAANSEQSNQDPLSCLSLFNQQYIQKYAHIIDEKDPSRGVDNYASSVMDLIKSARNKKDCESWNLQDVSNLSAFQQLESEAKKEVMFTQMIADFDQTLEFATAPQDSYKEERPKHLHFEERSKSLPEQRERINIPANTFSRPVEPDWSRTIPEQRERANPPASTYSKPVEPEWPKPVPDQRERAVPPGTTYIRSIEPESRPVPKLLPPPQPQPRIQVPPPERKVEEPNRSNQTAFRTAKEQFIVDQQKKNQGNSGNQPSNNMYGTRPKSLGTRRGLNSPFIPPIKPAENKPNEGENAERNSNSNDPEKILDERLKNIEPRMIELIENEIMDHGPPVHWDDIAGLEFAKKTIKEIVVWPMLRPDLFSGLRGPPRGILLFGPPGTGKTLIGKCIASQSKSTFFSISASSLTSKWVGEGEKMVRALFAVARVNQPSVIFIDEIDSLLSQRSDSEHESSRRIKTEFLVQLDGATTSSSDRILVIGATNRPQELDEAARRRLVKRLYIPLPEFVARKQLVINTLRSEKHCLTPQEIEDISDLTDGYSGADMSNLCKEAAFGPLREISLEDMHSIAADQVRPITREDFSAALLQVRASVSTQDLALYEDWNNRYGSGGK